MSWRRRTLAPDLASRVLASERDAVSEALNLADDRRPRQRAEAVALLDRLEREAEFPGAVRIGITGPPGAGKSTLLDALLRCLRPRGVRVAIVAVDPSSQRTGGALLGDRIRVRSGAGDPGVFIRSMAARDRLGGLADATRSAVVILSAAFDVVFVETVGVGQNEVDVADLVDTLIFVGHPDAGDLLQSMKAGILEMPDIFAINKSDIGESAARAAQELASGLHLSPDSGAEHERPVLLISARDGTGIDELVDAAYRHRRALEASGDLRARRTKFRDRFVLESLEARYGSYGIETIGGRAALNERLVKDPEASGSSLCDRFGREIESSLRKTD
jgi:LAO/AO transport system kinase